MLEKLLIENCQCWRKLELTFDPNITTIVGPSNRGKSTIIRALKAVLLNDVKWKHFKSYGESTAKITVDIDGSTITRVKSATENEFILQMPGQPPEKTNDSSERLQTIINMGDVNLQNQSEQYFLVNQSPGQVAKSLNNVAGLGDIDVIMKNANSAINNTGKEFNKLDAEVDALQKQYDSLLWVPDALAEIDVFITEQNILHELSEECEIIESLLNEVNDLESELAAFFPVEAETDIQEMMKTARALQSEQTTRQAINQNLYEHTQLQNELSTLLPVEAGTEATTLLTTAKQLQEQEADWVDLHKILIDIHRLQENEANYLDDASLIAAEQDCMTLVKKRKTMQDQISSVTILDNAIESIRLMLEDYDIADADVQNAEQQHADLLATIDICPICKRPMDGDTCAKTTT